MTNYEVFSLFNTEDGDIDYDRRVRLSADLAVMPLEAGTDGVVS